MDSKDWEAAKTELQRKAADGLEEIKKSASAFVEDHPEIKETVHRVEGEAMSKIKQILSRRK